MGEKSELLRFSEGTLQEVALVIMALVYTTRLIWLLKFKPTGERQARTGLPGRTPRKGILYSWAIIAMPWAMESSRTRFLLYLQFVIFHLGVAAAILLSFIIPYLPQLLGERILVLGIQGITGAACAMGLFRLIRRVSSRSMRAISSPDDYFSLTLLIVWLLFATLAAPNSTAGGEGILLTFFILTAFFLIYVPFSKISHYLYYPFTRYYFGKTMGRRGVYPLARGPVTSASDPSTPVGSQG